MGISFLESLEWECLTSTAAPILAGTARQHGWLASPRQIRRSIGAGVPLLVLDMDAGQRVCCLHARPRLLRNVW
jgi:hypothetical protein